MQPAAQSPVSSGVPQLTTLSLMLFSIFITYLVGGIKHTCHNFADDRKLVGVIDALLEGPAALRGAWTGWRNGPKVKESRKGPQS